MSFGILVGRFGSFVEEQTNAPVEAPPEEAPFPDDIAHLRDSIGHHLVALTLLARSDGDFADVERTIIVGHCLKQAKKNGISLSDKAESQLETYLVAYTPARTQLMPAIRRLEQDSTDDLIALIRAAQAVIEADGITRPAEARLLTELQDDLKIL
jgi:hypothetical protein